MDAVPEFLQRKYDAVEFIDRGAYGRVYKCTSGDRTTAVKILDGTYREMDEQALDAGLETLGGKAEQRGLAKNAVVTVNAADRQ